MISSTNQAGSVTCLFQHTVAEQPFAWVDGRYLNAGQFLSDIQQVMSVLPSTGHMINLCENRYHFCVVFAAALLSQQVSLLPASHTPNMISQLKLQYPDLYCVVDGAYSALDLPSVTLPRLNHSSIAESDFKVPQLANTLLAAIVFTSGSTGMPQANHKTWGKLCLNARAEARRLMIKPEHHVLATVPAQHMFGFESSVLMPWQAACILHSDKPFYPADVLNALTQLPAPRCLIITPFHLRALIESKLEWPSVEVIVCATAPLPVALAVQAELVSQAILIEIYGCTESGQLATRRTATSVQWQTFDGASLYQIGDENFAKGSYIEGDILLSDVLSLHTPTTFTLLGRNSDMVNIAGKRSSLAYLNQQLLSVPGVVDGFIFAPKDNTIAGIQRLSAFVVAPTLNKKTLLTLLRGKIDAVFLPRVIYFIDQLPRNSTGKVTMDTLQTLLLEYA
jgi:acyl-coenzyme A synthetase/AMP-(fatty) acid ligase